MAECKKKMLITGVSGMLGNNLSRYFVGLYDIEGWFFSHPVSIDGTTVRKVDITDKESVRKMFFEARPDVVIHCASHTNVDFCQTHEELTRLVNVEGTCNLVEACKETSAKFVYISTDSVYDGQKGDYSEIDPVNPPNYYGQSKYEGEKAASVLKKVLILRTNMFGWNVQDKNGLAEWIFHELVSGHTIKGFKDVRFSSIYTFDFARLLMGALEKDLCGLYNFSCKDSMTKYEFACALARHFNFDTNLIEPVDVDEFPFSAKRGKNLSLNVAKLSRDLGVKPPSMEESLENFCRDSDEGMEKKIKGNDVWYPRLSFIPYGRQSIDAEDIAAVAEVLKSSNLTQGKKVVEFEEALCRHCGSRFAVAFNSGTSALHCACLAAGIKAGDEVITSANTFVASVNCAVYCAARPVFTDIDRLTYNIDPVQIEQKITAKTKAVIPVHFAGQSCDMEKISAIIKRKGKELDKKIFIIEDACHALGSLYKKTVIGSCVYSDMTALSFHPVKHITTGEGGAVLTNDKELARKLQFLRSHGITNFAEEFVDRKHAFSSSGAVNPWYYEQQILGFNYRITDIQCALGISQIKKLPFFMKRRREIAARYNTAFAGIKTIQLPYEMPGCVSNWHLYVLAIDFSALSFDRGECMRYLKDRGILTQVHYIPVHTHPFYRNTFGTAWGDCPCSEEYYAKCLSIPLFPTMSETEIESVITYVKEIGNRSGR